MYELNGQTHENQEEYKTALKLSTNRNQAYVSWNEDLDEKLLQLKQTHSISELADHFKRTEGAISSRLKKLEAGRPTSHRRRLPKNSNLFAIDFGAIEAVLEDANRELIAASNQILERSRQFPENLNDNKTAEKLANFLRELEKQKKEVSQARLADGRPFTDASKVVKRWFSHTENELKEVESQLKDRLAKFSISAAIKANEVRISNEQNQSQPQVEREHPIGQSLTGDVIVTVNTGAKTPLTSSQQEPEVPNVKLTWQVKDWEIENLNLEMLRHHFSDGAIRYAINAHIKENGPNKIPGVAYEQVVGKDF